MDIDKNNQKNKKVILDKYGWIEQSKIGTKAADAFFYIIQHSEMELMDKWYPDFKRLADNGEANARQCAMMEDRLLMRKGKRQIYGTQASDFRTYKKMAIWPIENPENVNERRRKIGFKTTVEEYAKEIDAIFDIRGSLITRFFRSKFSILFFLASFRQFLLLADSSSEVLPLGEASLAPIGATTPLIDIP